MKSTERVFLEAVLRLIALWVLVLTAFFVAGKVRSETIATVVATGAQIVGSVGTAGIVLPAIGIPLRRNRRSSTSAYTSGAPDQTSQERAD